MTICLNAQILFLRTQELVRIFQHFSSYLCYGTLFLFQPFSIYLLSNITKFSISTTLLFKAIKKCSSTIISFQWWDHKLSPNKNKHKSAFLVWIGSLCAITTFEYIQKSLGSVLIGIRKLWRIFPITQKFNNSAAFFLH